MADTRQHPMFRPAETAMLMTEMLWPPLAALRVMESWSSSASSTREAPGEIALLRERVGSLEEHESTLQSSVEPIEGDLDDLKTVNRALKRQLSNMDAALRAQRKELDGLRKSHAELESRSDLSPLKKELDGLRKSQTELPSRSDVDSLKKELNGLRKSSAGLERQVAALRPAMRDGEAARPAGSKTAEASEKTGRATPAARTASGGRPPKKKGS